MWTTPENPRGVHAVRVLEGATGFTLDKLIAAAYDPALPAFEPLLPRLFAAFDSLGAADARRARLAEPVAALRAWDVRWDTASVPTSLAVFWGEDLMRRAAGRRGAADAGEFDVHAAMAALPADERIDALAAAVTRLERDFGRWRTPWGEINRFQRLTGDAQQAFDDARPSFPVGFTSATWGSLASFAQRGPRTTKRIYGSYGNSFVAVVEFGPKVRARSVLAGGVSGDPASPHFADQAAMYARGQFKEVLFDRADVERGAVRRYHPGDRSSDRVGDPPGGR
jgi:acyl-homoserine-lactone acylase